LFVALWSLPAEAQTCGDASCTGGACVVEDPLAEADRMCAPEVLCDPPRGPWYARADFLMLRRDAHGVEIARADTLLTDNIVPQDVALTTNDFEEPFRPGMSVMIGHTLGESPYQIEFTYFTVNNWESALAVRDTTENELGSAGNLYSRFSNFGNPAALAGFDYNNYISIREQSDLYNVEVNVRHLLPIVKHGMAVSWLVGVRHIGIGEQFDYLSESYVPTALGSTLNLATKTHNDLWGAQVGSRVEIYVQNNCWINFEAKGALCSNSTRQETSGGLQSGSSTTTINQERSDNVTAYVGDLALELVYRPTPHLATRFGYQALWVDRLTLAAENFSPPAETLLLGPPQINVHGNVVYHGPHIGLEVTW
jgi:hypothetical protein